MLVRHQPRQHDDPRLGTAQDAVPANGREQPDLGGAQPGAAAEHLLAGANDPLPNNLQPFAAQLARRSMIVKKAQPLAIECVVRGYLAGSGWKEYREQQTVCGIKLPPGLDRKSVV